MNKRLTISRVHRWVYALLALLPFILIIIIGCKVYIDNPTQDVYQYVFTPINKVFTILQDFSTYLPWFSPLISVFRQMHIIGSGNGAYLFYFIFNYMNYLVVLSLVDLIFYAFTFFLSLIRSMVNKLGGDL